MELLCLPHTIPENWIRGCSAEDLRKIAASFRQSAAELDAWKERLAAEWTEPFFDLDAADLLRKFRTEYRALFKWLNSEYRNDVRRISRTRKGLNGNLNDADCEAALTVLQSYQEMGNRVRELERNAGKILGSCFKGRETDWSLIGTMIDELDAIKEYERTYGLNGAEKLILCREASFRSRHTIGDLTAREWISSGRIGAFSGSPVWGKNAGEPLSGEGTTDELTELFEDYLDKEMVEQTSQILLEKLFGDPKQFEAAYADAMTACSDAAVGDVCFKCLCSWFPGEDLENIPLGVLSDRITECRDPEKLSSWVDYSNLLEACRKEGLEEYIEYLEETGEQDIVNVYRKGFLIKHNPTPK